MSTKKYKITQLQQDDSLLELHPETDADIVNVTKGTGAYQGTASNVQDALEEVYALAATGGVTGVKGNAESTYRTGNVNLTPANIGAEAAFTDGSATIATESSGIVTIKAGVSQTSGAIGNSSGSDIVLGAAAKKSVSTSIASTSTDSELATAKAVYSAITALPVPMQFKGTVGTGGTVTTLPAAAASNNGYAYKVITDGTYGGTAAKVGDMLISNGTAWILIPSGDEPSGTVTSVGMTVPTGLQVSGSPITSSGTLAVTFASGYSIPTTTKQSEWDSKQSQIAATGSTTKPVYFSAAGTIAEASDYAGGTKVTLNGVDKGASTATIYAPTKQPSSVYWSGGVDTYVPIVVQSNNGGMVTCTDPTWEKLSEISVKSAEEFTSAKSVTLTGDVTGTASSKAGWSISTTLANSGVTAGTYSAVTVNAKGIVTAGAQFIEVGTTGQTAPSANLAVGGLFFQEI